jgi:hypothetical protein
MSFLILFFILLILLVIWAKMKEKRDSNKIINTKTGKAIPYYTIFQSAIKLIKRFTVKNYDLMALVRENVQEKGNIYAVYFSTKFVLTIA